MNKEFNSLSAHTHTVYIYMYLCHAAELNTHWKQESKSTVLFKFTNEGIEGEITELHSLLKTNIGTKNECKYIHSRQRGKLNTHT